jgi:hypothetical protein
VLAILTLNDEDDCSSDDTTIYSPTDPSVRDIPFDLRCHTLGTGAGASDVLYPITRYVDGFLGLRSAPSRLVFATITGVPPDVAGASPTTILADTRMVERVDPTSMTRLVPACTAPDGRGVAYPAIRMTRVAAGLEAAGAHVTVQSICTADFGPAIDELVGEIAAAL